MSFSKNKVVFTAAVALLLSLSVILYLHMKRLIQSAEDVNNTRKIQLNLEQTVSNLREAETSQRGFLLSNDLSFLRSKNEATQKVYSLVSQLYRDISDANQRKKLDTLQILIIKRLERIEDVLSLYKQPFVSDSENIKKLFIGEKLMDQIRSHVNQMEEQQLALLTGEENILQRYVFLTPVFTVVLIFFSLLLLTFANFQTLRQLRISTKYLAHSNDLNLQLQIKKEEIEKVNDELESFNYIASHDLKEPVRKIAVFCSMIASDRNNLLSEESHRIFGRIKSSTDRMSQLLTDLLQFSRISTAEKIFEKTDLNEIIVQVRQILEEEISQSGGIIKESHLPSINAIPSQMVQLFVNLTSNSLKFRIPDVSPIITISSSVVSATPPDDIDGSTKSYYRVLVKDNGIGLDKEFKDKAFELFSRLHTNENYPGTGAGLTICKKIVQNHNGFIELYSEKGNGAEFQLYFPV